MPSINYYELSLPGVAFLGKPSRQVHRKRPCLYWVVRKSQSLSHRPRPHVRHHQSNVDSRRSTVCVQARTLAWTPAVCAAPNMHCTTQAHNYNWELSACAARRSGGRVAWALHIPHTPCPDIPTGPVELLQLVSALFLQPAPSIPPLHAALPDFHLDSLSPSIRALLSCVGVASLLGLPFLLCPINLSIFCRVCSQWLAYCYFATCCLAHALLPHPAQQYVALLPV